MAHASCFRAAVSALCGSVFVLVFGLLMHPVAAQDTIPPTGIVKPQPEILPPGVPGLGANDLNNRGGITARDFDTLIQLMQNTVSSDSWEANGGGNGTAFPYPSGVYVDAKGVLHRIPKSIQRSISQDFVGLAPRKKTAVDEPSPMRKVSLTRLGKAVQKRVAAGQDLTDEMRYLAGLSEIRYVMRDVDSGEVIVAGPAAGWQRNQNGKTISDVDGQPVLFLDDLIICLRNAFAKDGKFGCSIVPRKANLAATKQYVSTAKGSGKRWQKGLQEALGKQDVDVFGIDASTRAARVIVEADYHMKLLGMGIEPSILSVPSYLQRVKLDTNGNPPPMDVVRWWFALSYDRLISNADQTLFEFTGPSAQVLAETELLNNQGDRIHTGKAVGPTRTFARDFSKHFSEIAKAYPVYNELRNVFDLAIVANLIHEFDIVDKESISIFLNDDLPLVSYHAATEVDSVMNDRRITDRRGGQTTIHTLIGVSGGVSFDAKTFVNAEQLETETDIEFTGQLPAAIADMPAEHWWWD